MKPGRWIFTVLAFSALTYQSFSQHPKIEKLVQRKPSFISRIDTSKIQNNQYFLAMDFDAYQIRNPVMFEHLYDKPIEKIELFYTAFQVSDSFKQSSLNRRRLEELHKLIPSCFDNDHIVWRFVGQTKLKTPEEGKTMFHGFIITYRDHEVISRTEEVGRVDSVTAWLSEIKDSVVEVKCETKQNVRRKWNGTYYPVLRSKRERGITYRRKGIWRRERVYLELVKTRVVCDTVWATSVPPGLRTLTIPDSTVLKIFERNSDWKSMVITCDITGSMYPYIMQLQVWLRLNMKSRETDHFVFFNDGDMKPDSRKHIGKIGGIYEINSQEYEEVIKECTKGMRNGNGGDGPENNIEALIKAEKFCPECKDYILIADNYAPVKDIRLLKNLKKPVHVILCGAAHGYINTEYLDIARATGGSIHTLEQDISHLMELNEGESIEIGGQKYRILKGKFEPVKSS